MSSFRYAIERKLLDIEDIKPLDLDGFSNSLGPGYAKPKYMPEDVGGRRRNCIPSQTDNGPDELMKDMSKWKRYITKRINRNKRLDKGKLARIFEDEYHGYGHVIIAENCDTIKSNPDSGGIMLYHQGSARDPVFYRWHQHIDDIAQIYYDRKRR